jgi:aspartyl-tRNA synthetase
MEKMKRTVSCGELCARDDGKIVILNGWVDAKRDHGGISFINLRDRYGITQLVADTNDASLADDDRAALAALHNEFCIAAEGLVRKRPDSMVNRDMITGEIELVVKNLVVLNKCETLPFQIEGRVAGKI